jgi:cytochrome o ubiquinol oxidase operon protein cyoD
MSPTLGYLISLALTAVAYFFAANHVLAGWALKGAVVALAIIQAAVQLFCFFRLKEEGKARWNLMLFLFMMLVLIVVVFGSLWIMYNLDYRMMLMEK